MENTHKIAEEVWTRMSTQGFGQQTSINTIEQAIKDAISNERKSIAEDVDSRQWSYHSVSWSMYFYNLWTLFLKPKYFFAAHYKCLQHCIKREILKRD